MKVEMVMPQMGESITEAKISKWRKKAGDAVEKDEIILEISTDKVDSEIPAPASGVISEMLFQEGDVVPVKTKIAVIDSEGKASASAPKAEEPKPAAKTVEAPQNGSSSSAQHQDESTGKFFSPLVRSLAEKHAVSSAELESIKGSGQGGRVNKEDLLAFVDSRDNRSQKVSEPAAARPAEAAPSTQRAISPAKPAIDYSADGIQVVPMDNMRQAIAEHMVRSKQTSPHVYSVQEVDVSAIAKFRAKWKEKFQTQEGFSLSFTPFFLEATVKALQQFPYVNASVDGKKIILKKHINLGCAVALGNTGLIVPVIKRAEEKNFVGLARSLNDLAARARTKKLLPDEVTGGSFTVTNPGVFGTIIGTPIINQPQVAILCLGAIVKRPVVVNDMIAIREMCYLTLSYDHRIVDGGLGGQFLAAVRQHLENWDLEREI